MSSRRPDTGRALLEACGRSTRSSSHTGARPATGRSTPSRRTAWRSRSAPTTSSPTWCPPGRRPRRAARGRDQPDHQRRPARRVRGPDDHQGDRRRAVDGLVRRGLHARRDQDAARGRAAARAAAAQHPLRRPVRRPDVRRDPRPGGRRVRAAGPRDRRLPGDQAPLVLRRPRPRAGGAAARRAVRARVRRPGGSGLHPVLRARQPPVAAVTHRTAAGAAGRGHRSAWTW